MVAIPVWHGRISPLFDTATRFALAASCESDSHMLVQLPASLHIPHEKAQVLSRYGVCTVLCGAISRPFLSALQSIGIEVVPFLVGTLPEVLAAYREGETHLLALAMPGCCKRRRKRIGGKTFINRFH